MTRREWLASDDNPDVVQRLAYRELAARLAGGPPPEPDAPPPPAVPLALSLRATRLGGRNCPEADAPACGCPAKFHCGRLGRDAWYHDCLACPRVTGEGPEATT